MTDKLDPLRGRMHTLEGRLNVLSKGKFNNGAYSRGLETCTVGDVLRAMDSIPRKRMTWWQRFKKWLRWHYAHMKFRLRVWWCRL